MHLAGIHTLNAGYSGITDAGLARLAGVHTLSLQKCENITGAGFAHLKGIHALDITDCWWVTAAGVKHLRGIHTLVMGGCTRSAFEAARKLRPEVCKLEGVELTSDDQYEYEAIFTDESEEEEGG